MRTTTEKLFIYKTNELQFRGSVLQTTLSHSLLNIFDHSAKLLPFLLSEHIQG